MNMKMDDYNKIMESIVVRSAKAYNYVLNKGFTVYQFDEGINNLILVNKGTLKLGDMEEVAHEGDVIFMPAKYKSNLKYKETGPVMSTDQFFFNRDHIYELNRTRPVSEIEADNVTILSFDAVIFDTVDFFHTLELPSFIIRDNPFIARLVKESGDEDIAQRPGRLRVISLYAHHLALEVLRYVMHKKIFLEQIATNIVYFKDPRLVKIFYHIRRNLSGDLSNKVLADLAGVSEDYVGQYFKALTGINPQDYIEYQRMEEAIHLLRTSKLSIAEIGSRVGFNGTAYFCRRFKMMFGIPAAKMRRRENMLAAGDAEWDEEDDD